MKKIIMKLLAFFSKRIVVKYQPKIIGITGSLGKTSSKDFIANLLQDDFRVRASIKNYNNEFGLPLTIIGEESPGKNAFLWLALFVKASRLLLFKDKFYPEILVLEMGVDRSGDLDYLLSIIKPDLGLITNISHSHIEYFGSLEKIKKEKEKLVFNLNKNGLAVFNFDNEYLRDLPARIKSRSLSYGFKEGADLLVKDLNFIFPKDLKSSDFYGANFKLEYQGALIPVNLPGVISYASIYSFLSALAVASFLDLNILELVKRIKFIPQTPGRMMLLEGIKDTIIIDDTYNSSPESSLNALKTLDNLSREGRRKIVVLGDMLELGHYSEEGHYLVGQELARLQVDLLFLIGERARDIGRGAIKAGLSRDKVFYFAKALDARDLLKNRVNSSDLILFKASQGIRLEKLVKDLMAEPEEAANFLVRQGPEWKNK